MAPSTPSAHTAKERTALSMALVSSFRKAGNSNSHVRPAALPAAAGQGGAQGSACPGSSHWSISSGWDSVSSHRAACS